MVKDHLRQMYLLLICLLTMVLTAVSQSNDVTNEWPITAFPHYPIKGNLISREKAWMTNTFYGIANVEPMIRFDKDDLDPMRAQVALGYLANPRVRVELLYYANWGWVAPSNDLGFTENIIRLNVKVGLKRALLSHVWKPDTKD